MNEQDLQLLQFYRELSDEELSQLSDAELSEFESLESKAQESSIPSRTPEQIAQQGASEYDAMMRQISDQQGGGVDEALQRAFPRTMSQEAPQTLLDGAASPSKTFRMSAPSN